MINLRYIDIRFYLDTDQGKKEGFPETMVLEFLKAALENVEPVDWGIVGWNIRPNKRI